MDVSTGNRLVVMLIEQPTYSSRGGFQTEKKLTISAEYRVASTLTT
jgi:hypothetical protein